MVKVQAHRGEPLNERADTQAVRARQLPPECRQWTTRTPRNDLHMTRQRREASVLVVEIRQEGKGGAEFQRQKVLNRAAGN
jgi:hypothetical protein